METLSISCTFIDNVRLDFPSDFVLSALPFLWDDEKNHQICFLTGSRLAENRPGRSPRSSEYWSMIASADLVLPCSPAPIRNLDPVQDIQTRTFPVPFIHQLMLDAMLDAEDLDAVEASSRRADFQPLVRAFRPQKIITGLLSALEIKKGSVFLVGGDQIPLIKAQKNLRATYPGLAIVGSMSGRYRPHEEPALVEAIQKGSPSLILLGSPIPDEECWIPRHMSRTRSGIFLYYAPLMRWLSGA